MIFKSILFTIAFIVFLIFVVLVVIMTLELLGIWEIVHEHIQAKARGCIRAYLGKDNEKRRGT